MQSPFEAFAACLPGLEPLLARELEALGLRPTPLAGGVAFSADAAAVQRAGLWLGTASHVLLRLTSFPCRALGELERKAALLPWRQWLRPGVPVDVRATSHGSRIYHTGAIVERMLGAITGAIGTLPPTPSGDADPTPVARLAVRFARDVCTVSLDATATPLHRRGYRLASAKAPLREDLAHALLLAAGFSGDLALLDPMCGAGTIAIEAAGLAAGLAPGRLRPPPLVHLALFDAEAWTHERERTAPPRTHAPIAASDRDAGAVTAARENAERAGVAAAITFAPVALSAQPWFADGAARPPRGLVATNPPFGRRVQAGADLLPLYQTLGHRVQRLGADWRLALVAHDVRLARRTGVPLQAAFTTRHGGLSITALCSSTAPAPEPSP